MHYGYRIVFTLLTITSFHLLTQWTPPACCHCTWLQHRRFTGSKPVLCLLFCHARLESFTLIFLILTWLFSTFVITFIILNRVSKYFSYICATNVWNCMYCSHSFVSIVYIQPYPCEHLCLRMYMKVISGKVPVGYNKLSLSCNFARLTSPQPTSLFCQDLFYNSKPICTSKRHSQKQGNKLSDNCLAKFWARLNFHILN